MEFVVRVFFENFVSELGFDGFCTFKCVQIPDVVHESVHVRHLLFVARKHVVCIFVVIFAEEHLTCVLDDFLVLC